jgi:hypothetical protein
MYRVRHVSALAKRGCLRAQPPPTLVGTGAEFSVVKRWSSTLDKLYPGHDSFPERHIGPNEVEKKAMLDFIGMKVGQKTFIFRVIKVVYVKSCLCYKSAVL